MAIWLGIDGGVRLKRTAAGPVFVYVGVADVDPGAKRLSADRAVGALITGDRVAVSHVDESGIELSTPLPFMAAGAWPDGNAYPDGQWYVNVDPIGGVRFYESWADALNGGDQKALPLKEPADQSRVRLDLVEGTERCLAQTQSWELNTNREVADITPLGEGFQQNMALLVTGSGELDCLFDAGKDDCEGYSQVEKSMYLHQLALRQEVGSTFTGVFLLKREGTLPIDLDPTYRRQELFYLCDCVISGVVSTVNTEDVIHSKISFITTGPIQLLYDYPQSYLLQEGPDENKVLQENDFGIVVDLPL